ncbi:hypothetical protein MBLNU457_6287t2 [Dothideomycetes sp. NU457]
MAEYRKNEYFGHGPLAEYDQRVKEGRLRNDDHQRNLISSLQDLHDMLVKYKPPKVVQPSIESLQPKQSFFGALFGSKSSQMTLNISDDLPKGLYMYGDVGSGKTMLMDLFYDTLPKNIQMKMRIHFHNFMQDVHKDLHKVKMSHGNDIDAIPFVAANIAAKASVLCFDEFQCTDVADAMILRRLVESLMHHGTVIVTTSNRHPSELYKNGIQRESFIPCINLLEQRLRVINLDSTTDYRKIPRPPSGVYHHPLDTAAHKHADHWFSYLGDIENDPPHAATHEVWGRPIRVPKASGSAAWFTFHDLIGSATGAADYIELTKTYKTFVVTDVPGMNLRTRDLARRFITFIDAVYEARAKLVLTTEKPLTQLFMTRDEVDAALEGAAKKGDKASKDAKADHADVDDTMRMMMDDLGMNMNMLKSSNMFTGDEEAFAFARALSRLTEMGSKEWVEWGMGLQSKGSNEEQHAGWEKMRTEWKEESGKSGV